MFTTSAVNARAAWTTTSSWAVAGSIRPRSASSVDKDDREGESEAEDHDGRSIRAARAARAGRERSDERRLGRRRADPHPGADPGRRVAARGTSTRARPRRLGEDLGRRAIEDHPAVAHDDDPLERLGDERHVVADRDDRPAQLRESGDDLLDPGDAAGVLAGRRLVEDDDRRPHREDRGEREQLPARVAQVVRVRVRVAAQPRRRERRGRVGGVGGGGGVAAAGPFGGSRGSRGP